MDVSTRVDARRGSRGLLHRFDSSGRIAVGAISYIHYVTRQRSLLIQSFHTLDDYAIVKCQSLFQLPK